jgi:small subunit ribosomal protein S6
MIKDYEMMVIFSPKLSSDLAKQANDKALALITDNGGELIKTDDWGKRILAYPINKLNEGYYFVNYFRFESTEIKTIKKQYSINEDIIRLVIIVRDGKK